MENHAEVSRLTDRYIYAVASFFQSDFIFFAMSRGKNFFQFVAAFQRGVYGISQFKRILVAAGQYAPPLQQLLFKVVPSLMLKQTPFHRYFFFGFQGLFGQSEGNDAACLGISFLLPTLPDIIVMQAAPGEGQPQVRPFCSHAQGTYVCSRTFRPYVGMSPLGHAGCRVGIIVVEGCKNTDVTQRYVCLRMVAQRVALYQVVALISAAYDDAYASGVINGFHAVGREAQRPVPAYGVALAVGFYGQVSQSPAVIFLYPFIL